MIKVAYDPLIFSGQIYGGISRYFCEIASKISNYAANKVSVSIVAPMHKNKYLDQLPKSIIKGFKTPFPSNLMPSQQRAFSFVIGDLTLRIISPDIIHETYYFRWPLGPKKAIRVLTIYDMIHEKFKSQFPMNDKTSQYKALAAERADHIICISEATKKDVIHILGIKPEKISVIHLGFDLMINNKLVSSIPDMLLKKPYLLYVGSRGGYKNFDMLVRAYASSSMLKGKFNLICFGGRKFSRDEIALFEELELSDEQVLQYSGDDKFLANFYKKASMFVYPSLYEGFGIPPLEAMAYDCPVACSNTSSIPEVVADAGIYFDPTNIHDMRAKIEMLADSPTLRDSLIKTGRIRLRNFSWDKCADETFKVYKKLV
jgi:glycosyltransferase involved in cell wall biosynthesis